MILLLAGFVLSLLGSLPPGLISLSVAHTAMQRGWWAAIVLAAGAAAAEFFQAWGAVLLTDWFLSHPAAERAFQWAAVPIFLGLAGHLLFLAKPPRPPAEMPPVAMARQFAKGVVVSVFNLLAIPYWFVYCGWLRVEGWWREGWPSTMLFAAGVTLGTVAALALYAWLGHLILQRSATVARQANRVVGLIFLGLGLKLLWGLW
jgi:threonine/homoserine/homoserine lactone efflux protein